MASYAYLQDGEISGLYDSLPVNWQNISNFYSLSDDEIIQFGWRKIIKPGPSYDSSTQKIENIDYYLLGDNVYERYQIVDLPKLPNLSEYEIVQGILQQWEEVRKIRDEKMNEFQWRYFRYERAIRMGLTPIDDLSKMDSYMQALADITLQEDPFNLIWPEYTE